MDPDVSMGHGAVEPDFRNGRPWHREHGGDNVHPRWRSADERDGHGVCAGVAVLQTGSAVAPVDWSRVVMRSGRVVMLGMVVVIVGVRVQRGDYP